MRKIHRAPFISLGALALLTSTASAQIIDPNTNTGPILVPSTSSSYNQQGFNLPSAPRPTGQDIVRGSGGISCQSAVSGNGPVFDLGVIGTNDIYSRDSTAVYGRITVPLGKKPRRVDCSKLYDLEIQRLKMELKLMRAGGFGGFDDMDGARDILHKASTQPPEPAKTHKMDAAPEPVAVVVAEAKPNESNDEPEPTKVASLNPDIVGSIGTISQDDESQKDDYVEPLRLTESPRAASLPQYYNPNDNVQNSAPDYQTPQYAEIQPRPSYDYGQQLSDHNLHTVELATIGNPAARLKADRQQYHVQLGAFSSQKNSENAWNTYRWKIPNTIRDYSAVVSPITKNGKTLYHLRVGPFDRHMTRKVCRSVKNGCFAVKS